MWGISKALAALRTDFQAGSAIVAFGDDGSDADLFRALPGDAMTVGVGRSAPDAKYHIPDCDAVRTLLRSIVVARRMASATTRKGTRGARARVQSPDGRSTAGPAASE